MVVDLIIGTTLIALAFDSYVQRQRLQRADNTGCPRCGRNLRCHESVGGRLAFCPLCRQGSSLAQMSPSVN